MPDARKERALALAKDATHIARSKHRIDLPRVPLLFEIFQKESPGCLTFNRDSGRSATFDRGLGEAAFIYVTYRPALNFQRFSILERARREIRNASAGNLSP